jgi:parvulin-like peptidyl-prolyl isomerase
MGGAEAFEKWLREHRLSLDSLKAVLTERERRRNLAVQAIARGVHLDGAALATFERRRRESGEPLEEVNLAQILVRCPAEKQQTEEGRELYQQALYAAREAGKNPERFRQYVAGFSDDPAGRVRGGLLGWLDPQTLREELRERVATMKAGDISAPVAGAEGFHVLFLLDRRSMRDLAFAEAFAAHREQLAMQLREDARLHFYDLRGRPVQLPILPPMMDALQPDGAEDAGSATARPPRPAMPGLLEP